MGVDINFYANPQDYYVLSFGKSEYYLVDGIETNEEKHLLTDDEKRLILSRLKFERWHMEILKVFYLHDMVWLEVNH